MSKLKSLPEWQALDDHIKILVGQCTEDWFAKDELRFVNFSRKINGVLYDFSKNWLTSDSLNLLIKLAEACSLKDKIKQMFRGDLINWTEKRAVLHTALRAPKKFSPVVLNEENILVDVHDCLEKMKLFSKKVRAGKLIGATGKPIKDIVNIGIGGSDLGPRMAVHALSSFATDKLNCYFISDVDSRSRQNILEQINPDQALFIISSKSFTTPETRENFNAVYQWLKTKLSTSNLSNHFVAVTAATDLAINMGIKRENIFPIWDWVGGRYSVWSAIGLPIALMIGMDQFEQFLAGAHEVDQHFSEAPFIDNVPVIMALIGIWSINFIGNTGQVIAAYSDQLSSLREYIQQVDMESNGKRVDCFGQDVDYATGPIVFGESGCNAQHSFFQWLHQAPIGAPVDFILSKDSDNILLASALSQAKALMLGQSKHAVYENLISTGSSIDNAKKLSINKILPGSRSSSVIFLDEVNPKNLGKLLALYEHKIFVQGVIWQINSFDQWGVELGKKLMPDILELLKKTKQCHKLDSSTQGLIDYLS